MDLVFSVKVRLSSVSIIPGRLELYNLDRIFMAGEEGVKVFFLGDFSLRPTPPTKIA